MNYVTKKVSVFLLLVLFFSTQVNAAQVTDYSVTLSRLKTSVNANQEIKFVTPSGVSSGETITIEWSSEWSLNSFDFNDVDFAEGDTGDCDTSVFTDETLVGSGAGASEFNASVSGQILTLESGGASATIASGVCVRILIGTNASIGATGDTQITNPSNADDDDLISIGGTFGDSGTQYLDIIANDQVAISATVGSVGAGGGGGGGGGGGSGGFNSSVIFSGRAYPLSSVTLLKDGVIAVTTISGGDAKFNITLSNISSGNHTFTIYSTDSQGLRSNPFNVTLYITSGVSTTVSGIFLTPTISVDKQIVRRGDNLTVFGATTPSSNVIIEVNSENQLFFSTNSANDGAYLFTFDTSPLELGDHGAKSKSKIGTEISEYSKVASFKVGTQSEILQNYACGIIADLNSDCRVNLIDFSVLAYWYRRPLPPRNVDMNSDGSVSIGDFSIMAYYWTG